jgi:hypothetical protein
MLLFIDESGTDRKEAPYEVLAGVAIRERNVWPLIQAIRSAEREHFGVQLSGTGAELKGKKLLKRKVFDFANQDDLIPTAERTKLAQNFLEKGELQSKGQQVTFMRAEYTAYGQAVLAFVREVLALTGQHGGRVFASMVDAQAPKPTGDFLRKDYTYLFERFYYYLEDVSQEEMGLIVFDELERSFCQRLVRQMERYFLDTVKGRQRSSRILPEPLFVHSDLTTAVQVADIIAYSLNWGLRLNRMTHPIRPELESFAQSAFEMRYAGQRHDPYTDYPRAVWGITYLDDLRPRSEKL